MRAICCWGIIHSSTCPTGRTGRWGRIVFEFGVPHTCVPYVKRGWICSHKIRDLCTTSAPFPSLCYLNGYQTAELQHYQTLAHDLNVKMDAMERMAEQASGVKMALSRRLEQLIVELKEVRGVATRLAQQVRGVAGGGRRRAAVGIWGQMKSLINHV